MRFVDRQKRKCVITRITARVIFGYVTMIYIIRKENLNLYNPWLKNGEYSITYIIYYTMNFRYFGTVVFLVCLCLSSCDEERQIYPGSIFFNDNDAVEVNIEIEIENKLDLIPPIKLRDWRIYDTLLICYGEIAENNQLMHIYGLGSKKLIVSFASEGRGPGEYNTIRSFQVIPEHKLVFIPESGSTRKFAQIYSIDSLVFNSRIEPIEVIDFNLTTEEESVKIGSNIFIEIPGGLFSPVIMIDTSNYLETAWGRPSFILFRKKEVPSNIIKKEIGYPSIGLLDSTLNLNHYGTIFSNTFSYNSFTKKLVLGYENTDLLQVYDDNLNLTVQLQGPDFFYPVFEFFPQIGLNKAGPTKQINTTPKAISPMDNVYTPKGKARQAYFSVIAAKSGFYALYSGNIIPINNEDYRFPNRIFYFNYSGEFLKKFNFDAGIGNFLVSDNEDFILIEKPPYREIFKIPIK